MKLKKDGDVKQVIEVQPFTKASDDFFNINHRIFLKMNKLTTEANQKYSIYCVFNTEKPSVVPTGQMTGQPILYKIVPLKFPKI